MPNVEAVKAFLSAIDEKHPSVSFTIELTLTPFLEAGNHQTHVPPGDEGV